MKTPLKHVDIPCAECGANAAFFAWQNPVYTFGTAINTDMFTYCGIVFSARNGPKTHWTDTILDSKHADELLKLAAAKNYKKIDKYLRQIKGFKAGLDCYCDKCDKTYCGKHYPRKDEWSDDDTLERIRGTCPKGHERDLFLQD